MFLICICILNVRVLSVTLSSKNGNNTCPKLIQIILGCIPRYYFHITFTELKFTNKIMLWSGYCSKRWQYCALSISPATLWNEIDRNCRIWPLAFDSANNLVSDFMNIVNVEHLYNVLLPGVFVSFAKIEWLKSSLCLRSRSYLSFLLINKMLKKYVFFVLMIWTIVINERYSSRYCHAHSYVRRFENRCTITYIESCIKGHSATRCFDEKI